MSRKNLSFFDINGVIGQPILSRSTGNFSGYLNVEGLIDEMNYFGVDCALVTHWEALKYYPSVGNKKLIEEIRGHNRLYPCWVVMPHHTGEMPEPKELVKEMSSNNVKAIGLFPDLCGFSLEDWSIEPLLKELERVGTLVIVGGDVTDLYALCSKYPNLNFVASGMLRKLYPLLERFSNLYISLKDYRFCVIEDICKRFGADRIMFGTYYYSLRGGTAASPLLAPNCAPSSSKAMVTYADISEEEKGMIAGGNLRRLFGISSKPSVKYNFTSKVQRLASRGEKLPTPIIDSHFHLDPDIYEYKPGTSLAFINKMMDITGINKICINSSKALWGGNHYEGNDYIASVCKNYPERFIGFAIINPQFDDTEDEIKRCIEVLGLKGIKIHPRIHHCDVADIRYNLIWEASEKYQIPILTHTAEEGFGSNPKAFEEISKNYPKGTFILGHAATCKTSINIAKKRNNVYLDTAVASVNGSIEYAVSQIGADKIIFGSDSPFYDFNFALGYILYARISDEDKSKILGLNMRKILKIIDKGIE